MAADDQGQAVQNVAAGMGAGQDFGIFAGIIAADHEDMARGFGDQIQYPRRQGDAGDTGADIAVKRAQAGVRVLRDR